MSAGRRNWTRQQLLVAFNLYCQLPFGRLHSRNPEIIHYAEAIGRTPSALAMKLVNIASLDPSITSNGRKGLSSTSQADRDMWEEMQSKWEHFILASEQAISAVATPYTPAKNLQTERNYEGKNKTIQTTARIGQQFFRNAIMSAYDSKCCITGLSEPRLLVASHIVPWSKDSSIRLNPRNGLSLSMLHDKAFDIGLITINENMEVQISKKVSAKDSYFETSIRLYDGKTISLPRKFQPDDNFLKYHRNNIFEQHSSGTKL